ncbi:MAG TPA: right-handed parallel beta-helix repeat-containing protein [Tepidisphaeraceae bacterium]|nr:right-handed parallel beta-helix repeat-containing protein [Tepidisphaeraceae bacterium]
MRTGCTDAGGAKTEALEQRQLLSTSWFVSPSGSNQNPGTYTAPFQTIQAAANVAKAGDYVEIEAGTYHETVTPKYSGAAGAPITYEAFNHEDVTISGADPITGLTNSSGDVYEAPMSWDLGEGNNEVFVDGQAINEARWPNTSLNLMDPTLAKASSVVRHGNSITIYNAALNQPANYWKGAIVHIVPGQAWVAETDTVTSSAPGQFTFNFTPDTSYASYTLPVAGNSFYLTNSFKALDSDGEWYRDPTSGTLYLATPKGDDPNNHDIEAKARPYAFDLTYDTYTTVQGIDIFSATIRTSVKSSNIILNSIHAIYISQFVSVPKLWSAPSNSGIALNGPSDVLENSTIADSAGDGVFAYGADVRVTDNVIHDVDYSASDSAGIRVYGDGSEIDHNTIYNTGRDGIKQEASKLQILNNTLYNIGTATTEAGAIYTAGNNGEGTVIAYNTIHDMHSGGYGQTALFLDNNSSNYILHDNNVYDVDIAVKLNFTSANNKIYNNTLAATQNVVFGNYLGSWPGTSFTNNIFLGAVRFGSGASAKNNATTTGVAGTGAASFASGAASAIVEVPIGIPAPPAAASGDSSGAGDSSAGGSSSTSGDGPGAGGSSDTSGDTSTSGDAPPTTTDPSTPTDPTTPTSTPAPAPPVASVPMTVADWTAQVSADRTAITTDLAARKSALAQMLATVRADLSAYHTADRQFIAARQKAMHAKGAVVAPADVSSLDTAAEQLLTKEKADQIALAGDRRTDFTGIQSARHELSINLKSLAAAKRAARK